MATLSELIRKTTTFFLALFLWLHAIFFLTVPSSVTARSIRLLRLTSSELVLFGLLLVFSFLTASGFWKTFRSLVYIYFFRS
jgi:hypothetical protein